MNNSLNRDEITRLRQHFVDTQSMLQDAAVSLIKHLKEKHLDTLSETISESRLNHNRPISTELLQTVVDMCNTIDAMNIITENNALSERVTIPNDYVEKARLSTALLHIIEAGHSLKHRDVGSTADMNAALTDTGSDASLKHLYEQHGEALAAISKQVIMGISASGHRALALEHANTLDRLLDDGDRSLRL